MLPSATARLRFRQMTNQDLESIAALLGDPVVMTLYPEPKTRHEAAQWIDWNRDNYQKHGYGLWVVETHEGDFVGDCGLTCEAPRRQDGDGAFASAYRLELDAGVRRRRAP